jgi:ribosomal protein S18 acetylase RimI-like enzyme
MNGKVTTKDKEQLTDSKSTMIFREAHFWEGKRLGEISARASYDNPVVNFVMPYRQKHPQAYIRSSVQQMQKRLLDPRCLTTVACEASNPSLPVGFAQSIRVGTDEGAKRHAASRSSFWLWLLSWLFWAYCKIVNVVVRRNKSLDPAARAEFDSWVVMDKEKYWRSVPERHNRWHVQSVVVLPEFQGRGIGKKVMSEVMRRAESEGVPVGLQSSPQGEHMYRSIGFQLLGRFNEASSSLGSGGGIMMWSPPPKRMKEEDQEK